MALARRAAAALRSCPCLVESSPPKNSFWKFQDSLGCTSGSPPLSRCDQPRTGSWRLWAPAVFIQRAECARRFIRKACSAVQLDRETVLERLLKGRERTIRFPKQSTSLTLCCSCSTVLSFVSRFLELLARGIQCSKIAVACIVGPAASCLSVLFS